MMMFPLSQYKDFRKKLKEGNYPHLRVGQAFHNYMELGKITSPDERKFCDKLYEAGNEKAVDLIVSRIDENC